MSRTSITKHLVSTAAAGLLFVGLLSPAGASYHSPTGAAASHAVEEATNARSPSIVLASHQPWPAPVGHRQPRPSDLPQDHDMSPEERQQQQLDYELDRKLIICRGC
jgi:hypothetical protein